MLTVVAADLPFDSQAAVDPSPSCCCCLLLLLLTGVAADPSCSCLWAAAAVRKAQTVARDLLHKQLSMDGVLLL